METVTRVINCDFCKEEMAERNDAIIRLDDRVSVKVLIHAPQEPIKRDDICVNCQCKFLLDAISNLEN